MRLFLDTTNLEEIRAIKRWGVLAGLTSNPTLIAREHTDIDVHMKALCAEVDGPSPSRRPPTGPRRSTRRDCTWPRSHPTPLSRSP